MPGLQADLVRARARLLVVVAELGRVLRVVGRRDVAGRGQHGQIAAEAAADAGQVHGGEAADVVLGVVVAGVVPGVRRELHHAEGHGGARVGVALVLGADERVDQIGEPALVGAAAAWAEGTASAPPRSATAATAVPAPRSRWVHLMARPPPRVLDNVVKAQRDHSSVACMYSSRDRQRREPCERGTAQGTRRRDVRNRQPTDLLALAQRDHPALATPCTARRPAPG